MQYRREIDGLRAIAVIPVIFFHAGLSWLSGGFVGVDIFFVISGYLITSIILEQRTQDNFSLLAFYERRARRILPALFLVMLCCLPLAWIWMVPSQYKDFSQSLIAVTFFISNFLFWKQSGYFSAEADEKPLLHTWSLAVEEQYYILFPLFIMIAWRLGRQNMTYLIAFIALASFVFAQWLSRHMPSASFYILPTRAWELLAGSLVAFFLFTRKPMSNKYLASLGLLLILVSFFLLNEDLPFPSYFTLLPVLGTCLIILFSSSTWVAKILSLKLFVGIGLVSYSAYLWHQPLLAFARVKLLTQPPMLLMIGLALLSFVLAAITWRWVERPFRRAINGKFFISKNILLTCCAPFIFLFIGLGFLGHKKEGLPERFNIPAELATSFERGLNAYECFDLPTPHISEKWGCIIGKNEADKNIDFMVFGDSHLLVTYGAFKQAAENTNTKGFYAGIRQCTPFLGVHALRPDQQERNCFQLNKRVWEYARDNKIPQVIFVARWSYYTVGGYNGDQFSYIGTTKDTTKNQENSIKAFEQGLAQTIEAYESIGTKVTLVQQVPQQKFIPEEIYYKAYDSDNVLTALNAMSVNKAEHQAMQSYVTNLFQLTQKKYPSLEIADFTNTFCEDSCLVGTKKQSFYHDKDHLSVTGAQQIIKNIEALIDTKEH